MRALRDRRGREPARALLSRRQPHDEPTLRSSTRMSETRLQAESRTEFGKGAARRIRREAKVPAVLYGHGTDPVHITLPGHDTMMALKHGGANALLTIEIDGSTQLALPAPGAARPHQGLPGARRPAAGAQGREGRRRRPIHVVGEAGPDTLVVTEHGTISLEAEATHLPEASRSRSRAGGRHPDPRQGPHAALRVHAPGRRGGADRQHRRRAHRGGGRGRAGGGRGRGRHRARRGRGHRGGGRPKAPRVLPSRRGRGADAEADQPPRSE